MKPKCPCCDGTGEEMDSAIIGADMRLNRITSGIGLRDLARRLNLSHTYLTLLEQGERKWTPALVHDYLNEIGK